MLLGNARPGDDWTVLLSERFERRGAYDVPSGAVDWDSLGPSYVPQGGRSCHPDAWDPEDALFVPMRDQRGLLLGIISVDEPVSGRRPTDDELDVLVSLVDHAALAARGGTRGGGVGAAPARARGAARRVVAHHRGAVELRDPAPGLHRASATPSTSATSARRSSTRRPAPSCRRRPPAGSSRSCSGVSPSPSRRSSRCSTRCSSGKAATSSPTSRRGRGSASERRGLPVAAQRPRAVGVEPALADRPAAGRPRRAARDHLGRQPVRPARAVGRPAAGAADLRQRRRRRARLGPPPRRAAVPRQPRPAHAPPQPARLRRRASRARSRGRSATAAPSAS